MINRQGWYWGSLALWPMVFVACLQSCPAWAQGAVSKKIKIANDGSLAMIYSPGSNMITTVDAGSPGYERIAGDRLAIVDLFQLRGGEWVGFGNDTARSRPVVFSVDTTFHSIHRSPKPIADASEIAAASMTDDGTAYLVDREKPVVSIISVCDYLPFCTAKTFEQGMNTVYPDGPISQLVVDPATMLAAVVSPFGGEMGLVDIGFGKYSQVDSFRVPNLEPGAGNMEITLIPGGGDAPSSLYLGVPSQESVYLVQVDPSFRELRQTGTLALREFDKSAAPFIVETNASVGINTSGAPAATAMVAASDDQSLVLVGGVDSRVIHVISVGSTGVTRISDIHTEAPVVGFDVSRNGRFAVVLTSDGAVFLSYDDIADPANASQLRDLAGDPVTDAAITVALQKRLITEGFLVDVVDGMLGPNTISALQRYAARFDLSPPPFGVTAMQISPSIMTHLFEGHLSELPATYLATPSGIEIQRRSFDAYFARNFGLVEHFQPDEIFQLGRSQTLGSTCSNLNTFPSENLWPNIGDALTALETLRVQIGVTIRVLATYQTPDFANCAETPKAVQASAEQFRTITFQVGGSTVEKVLQLLGAADSTRVSISTNGTLIYLSGIPRAKPDLAERLGQWHAVVASHSLDRAGCAHAREDVFEFAKLLAESAAQGLPIYVSRTTGREVYAVSVDTGGDQALARKVVQLIRAAAPESADKRTGADSLVLSNKGWRLDDACRASAIIPPT